MKKLMNKKAFTIMEMLIVVAIIAVLVAIAIPTFSGALTKAKEAADVANVRAAYATAQVKILTDNVAIPNTAETNVKAKDTATDGKKFSQYLSGDLNYNKLSTTVESDGTLTITYAPTALTGGNGTAVSGDVKNYTWSLSSIDLSDATE